MCALAVHWGWLDIVPGFPDRLREHPPRQGFFEHPEYLAVRVRLPAPWQDILDLAYYSGWRKQEILGLTWEEIDEAGGVIRLSPGRSKTLVGRILSRAATVTVAEGPACVFVAVDHCTAECSGLHATKHGTRFEALEPIRPGMREHFGGIGDGVARGLRLRHDHGSNDRADDFQQEVAFFGIDSAPSFVREPEGNGGAERFIRTLKENLLWVRRFATTEDLRLALLAFKRTYNEQWMLETYDYRSPAQVRRDLVGLDAAA